MDDDSVLTLDKLMKAIESVMPRAYYLLSLHCPRFDENGKEVVYKLDPNWVCPHEVWVMHTDIFPAFMIFCKKRGFLPVDQNEWFEQEKDSLMLAYSRKSMQEAMEEKRKEWEQRVWTPFNLP